MRKVWSIILVSLLSACGKQAAEKSSVVVPVALSTERTALGAATDSAVWLNTKDTARSLILVTGGEGGLEVHDLSGKRVARFESIEAGFVDVRQNWVIVSDPRLGALRVYSFDTLLQTELTAQPLAVNDEITGLCTFESGLTKKLYVFIATDQGQLEQWELFEKGGKVEGRFIRRIAAGKGVNHCVADDVSGQVFFSEESVGIWRVAAEPESDSARVAVDLVAPRGSLLEEVKGLAIHRMGNAAYLLALNVGDQSISAYSLSGESAGRFTLAESGDTEGLTIVSGAIGRFPHGVLIVADEESGNYKLADWDAIAKALKLPEPSNAEAAASKSLATVEPLVETEPADSFGDAADDPAIWVDARNPGRSVIVATDKKLGLNVYDLDGKRLQVLPDGRMNNVDLREGFILDGKPIIVVTATNRTTKSISVYRLDPATRQLTNIADGVLPTGFDDPYGLCMYRNPGSGDTYVFANDSGDGKVRQWKLLARNGRVGLEQVREILVGSQAEGCVVDDELGHLYVAEEDVGLWKYHAEPGGGSERVAIDKTEGGNLVADVEGLGIWSGAGGKGFLVASNQGEDNYAVYRREGNNEFVGKFSIVANESLGIDGASETDGLDVVSAPLGTRFPEGLLVVQDGRNLMPAERQNFKLVSWRDVAATLVPVTNP